MMHRVTIAKAIAIPMVMAMAMALCLLCVRADGGVY